MGFKDSLHIASRDIFYKLFLSDRLLDTTKGLRNIKVAFEELRVRRLILMWVHVAHYE